MRLKSRLDRLTRQSHDLDVRQLAASDLAGRIRAVCDRERQRAELRGTLAEHEDWRRRHREAIDNDPDVLRAQARGDDTAVLIAILKSARTKAVRSIPHWADLKLEA